jgi:hypothetical protein
MVDRIQAKAREPEPRLLERLMQQHRDGDRACRGDDDEG